MFHVTTHDHSPTLEEVRVGTQGKILESLTKQKPWKKTVPDLFPFITYSAYFLIQLLTVFPWLASLIVSYALPHSPLIKKIPYRFAHRPGWSGHFSVEIPSFQMTLACETLTKYYDICLVNTYCTKFIAAFQHLKLETILG